MTVNGYATASDTYENTVASGAFWDVTIETRGYRTITVGIDTLVNVNVWVYWRVGSDTGVDYLLESYTTSERVLKTYDVAGQSMKITIFNSSPAAETVWVDYYLTA